MSSSYTIEERKQLYVRLYRECFRASTYSTADIDRAMRFYESCPAQIKDYARNLAFTEVFCQLKLLLSRVERNEYMKRALLDGNITPGLSRVIIDSTKQVKNLQRYLKALDSDIDILKLILEVDS